MTVHLDHGIHHAYKRKLIKKELKESPFKSFMDKAIYFIAIIGPIMTIPQLWTIWINQNASGVSIISWSTYLFTSFFWISYGFLHKEKPIIFSSAAWIVLQILIVIGTALYN